MIYLSKSAEISPCEIRSLLDYDRGQCAESSYLNRVTVLLYLTHLFVYSIVIWEGFWGRGGGEQRHIFIFVMAYVQ